MGNSSDPGSLALVWHTPDCDGEWTVETRNERDETWCAGQLPRGIPIRAPGIAPHCVFHSTMSGLDPGDLFCYRVARNGVPVFQSSARAKRAKGQASRVVLFGDCSHNRPVQREIARQAVAANPDFILLTGDMVYDYGRITEYREEFFPAYTNAMRSILFVPTPGNHDMSPPNFEKFDDALAYFLYWDQPLNGPSELRNEPGCAHVLRGNLSAKEAFLQAAGPRYPVMANYSFDYGDAHWTVLDSNDYMEWRHPRLRSWLAEDLKRAADSAWRFVAFHHPPFSSSNPWFTDQWMRPVAPLLEAGKVSIVFSGHRHNYQRSVPLKFAPGRRNEKGEVPGEFTLNASDGVVYVVSGAGGAELYDSAQGDDRATWQPFTDQFISNRHTLTLLDVNANRVELTQISDAGETVDRFSLVRD
ncbi:MAG TPA: metallophosphoesterase [Bryobacteraceae bacterium]|nr:metallophosphoesterase [Bryobacteraceae bacterium]